MSEKRKDYKKLSENQKNYGLELGKLFDNVNRSFGDESVPAHPTENIYNRLSIF